VTEAEAKRSISLICLMNMNHLKFHTISLKKRRNEARFVLNKKWSSKRYYMQ
jgi:hypothetical protein